MVSVSRGPRPRAAIAINSSLVMGSSLHTACGTYFFGAKRLALISASSSFFDLGAAAAAAAPAPAAAGGRAGDKAGNSSFDAAAPALLPAGIALLFPVALAPPAPPAAPAPPDAVGLRNV